MKKLATILMSLIIACSFMPCSTVFADDEETYCDHQWGETKLSYDDESHTYTRTCTLCGGVDIVIAPHDDITYNYKPYNEDKHRVYGICRDCGYKSVNKEAHELAQESTNVYLSLDDKTHMKEVTRVCSKCKDAVIDQETVESHRMGWKSSGSSYAYKCLDCGCAPESIVAKSFTKSVKVKKGTRKLTYQCATYDKLKSASVTSGKKRVSIKSKGNTSLYYKAKRKGSATIKVNMTSGATYTYKIKVK